MERVLIAVMKYIEEVDREDAEDRREMSAPRPQRPLRFN